MNIWLIVILTILFTNFIIEVLVAVLNLKALDPNLPKEFDGVYDKKKYHTSQEYTRRTTRFGIFENCISTLLTVLFLILGGFNAIDQWVRSFGFSEIVTGLIYIGSIGGLLFLIGIPFSIYSTFVIEEEFDFNNTTVKTFVLDIIKSLFLMLIIGTPLLALILWFFLNAGQLGWLYCWAGVILFSFIMQFLAPVLIMPLFNKFSPLEEGSLRDDILTYAKEQKFKIQGIFTMDGSKRSSKLNAFFTGFGKFRKIVFYDTLIKKLTKEEIVAVLAHEMGHFKLKHIIKMMFISIIQTGIIFFLLSIFLNNTQISIGLGMTQPSIYSSLFFFGFLYSPISMLTSILFNILSRKHEFEADRYAATTSSPFYLIESLKKLSKENLSNLTPHKLMVFIYYSHPPVLERIRSLDSGTTK